jgi:hypothetical protein
MVEDEEEVEVELAEVKEVGVTDELTTRGVAAEASHQGHEADSAAAHEAARKDLREDDAMGIRTAAADIVHSRTLRAANPSNYQTDHARTCLKSTLIQPWVRLTGGTGMKSASAICRD